MFNWKAYIGNEHKYPAYWISLQVSCCPLLFSCCRKFCHVFKQLSVIFLITEKCMQCANIKFCVKLGKVGTQCICLWNVYTNGTLSDRGRIIYYPLNNSFYFVHEILIQMKHLLSDRGNTIFYHLNILEASLICS